ncbi:MAG: acetone carboxylase [Rothia sp. (in: high G+C Gram-positive bacteria)]|uniref:acetone carboxylase n=1 Tax=Rothia sp. (in: high G+C Gram-positive bacteria) TaxID=1885016 RepID=UPI0026DF3B5C|nr:acetone carboxylase [Rothia sp. (in: high G+C Gram-positive bacteria)]MDO5750874.1 acetone carboxylase [Rothia sp. (in: high G+C Gram-positive bacteria)]
MDLLGALSSGANPSEIEAPSICSRKGCREAAEYKILWNNPKIHTPERRKTWLACSEHRAWLENYLQERSFWKETLPF